MTIFGQPKGREIDERTPAGADGRRRMRVRSAQQCLSSVNMPISTSADLTKRERGVRQAGQSVCQKTVAKLLD
jgi:hypothetical protein